MISSIRGYATTLMYEEDTNLTFTAYCTPASLQHDMSVDLRYLQIWLLAERLTWNVLKTEYMLVGSRQGMATLTQTKGKGSIFL